MPLRRLFDADLKLRQLRILVALEQLGQVQKVAEALHVTQPAISKQLRELESAVGVPLFRRHGNRLEFTVVGARLARRSAEILQQLASTETEIKALSQGLAGTLTVGTVTTAAQILVSESIVRLRQLAPGAGIQLIEGTADGLLALLKAGKLDIAVLRGADEISLHNEAATLLLEDPLVLCCRIDHPLLGHPSLEWSDLADASWVAPASGSPAYQAFAQLLKTHGLTLTAPIESISITANIAMLTASDLIGLLPLSSARRLALEHRVAILPLTTGQLLAQVSAHWHDRSSNPLVPIMLSCLQEVAGRYQN